MLMCVRLSSLQRKSVSVSTPSERADAIVPTIGRIRSPRNVPRPASSTSQSWMMGSSSLTTLRTQKSMSMVIVESGDDMNCANGLYWIFSRQPAGIRSTLLPSSSTVHPSVPSILNPLLHVLATTALLFRALRMRFGFASELLRVFGFSRKTEPAVGWNPPVLSTLTYI